MGQAAMDGYRATGGVVMIGNMLANARDLERELAWFARLLDARFKLYFGQACDVSDVYHVAAPDLSESRSHYAAFLDHYEFDFQERVLLILSLVPYVRPQLLDVFFTKNATFDRRFTEFGGQVIGEGRFIPTGETLLFILAGNDLQRRFMLMQLFEPEHAFSHFQMLQLTAPEGLSILSAPLTLSPDVVSALTTGTTYQPPFNASFPARRISTELAWDDLVMHPGTRKQIEEIEIWLQHGDTLMNDWGMARVLRPGYRALFHGPPGTGKTMTACLLGKSTGRDVYRVDLSLVISKYIGETEKNLAKVFDAAQNKDWILFFDEADALFGKRGETKDAHDRYANQEVSFLLQRVEVFDGIVILASNRRDDLDPAFARRFESIIYFPVPRASERLRLWENGLPTSAKLEPALDLLQLAEAYELTGGTIMNVVRYAALQALHCGDGIITRAAVLQGIRREYDKEGKKPF